MPANESSKLFISYAHEDKDWRDRFETMLAPAVDGGLISVWSDDAIKPGTPWLEEIDKAMAECGVALLLVSDRFFTSDFVKKRELATFLANSKDRRYVIKWVPIDHSLVQFTELDAIEACWDPKQPLATLRPADRTAAISHICSGLIEKSPRLARRVSDNHLDLLRSQLQQRLADKYSIVGDIAVGKNSIVRKAIRQPVGQVVAIKTLIVSELEQGSVELFKAAVSQAMKLQSPAFLRVLDPFLDQTPVSVSMEYVDGTSLDQKLKAYPQGLPLARVKSILLRLATAIEEIHNAGQMRGELCPSDLLVTSDWHVRLATLDFSNVLRTENRLFQMIAEDLESLSFMVPERFYGEPITSKADQYSLGLIAVELLSGGFVPRIRHACDLVQRPQLYAELDSGHGPWATRSDILGGVVCRMLRRDPNMRWDSMGEVRQLLKELEVEESPEERLRRRMRSAYIKLQGGGKATERMVFAPFYSKLLSRCPDLKAQFERLDMERQYAMLNKALLALFEFDADSASWRAQIEQVAALHARLQLNEQHFSVFADGLIEALAECAAAEGLTREDLLQVLAPGMDFVKSQLIHRAESN